MPAIVPARSPVHIFSTPSASTGRSWAVAAMVARCREELPPAHELSTLMMATSLRPALRSQVWPADAALVAQAAGHGVADDDQAELVRRHAGVGQGLVHDLVGHGLGREVAPAHVGHAGAEDGDVGGGHADTPSSAGRQLADEGSLQQAEMLHGRRAGHHHEDVAGAGVGVAVQRRGAGLGRARHEMALEGLGRQPVELGEPLGAPDGRLVVVSDTRKDDHAGLHGLGISAGLAVSRRRAARAVP